ncbi:TetR/AcrR family transcriptional regulator [Sphingomonas jatrophae]|uniref:TetR/AcrR family transcriptional regulator n=1 Tax=Sphingomonas jatrophae TaxID=1166337 RepID=UPI001F606921|nr:TetR/AcrR family transcriptional regulator [Sphingomonas jatrophae]
MARDLFVAEGFAAASMSSIAARLGGSKATLYKYFPSKEALFEAVMERKCATILATLYDPDPPTGDVRDLLRTIGRRMLEVIFQPDALALHRVVMAESVRFPEIARIFFAQGPERVQRQLAARLAALDARGVIACSDPLLTAQQFLAMTKGELHMRVICGLAPSLTPEEIERQIDHAVALIAPGLERQAPAVA